MYRSTKKISIYNCIGKGYVNGWWTNCSCRYRVYKGGRNTKKSYVIVGYEILDKIISSPMRNILIIRNTFTSHRFSTFSTLKMLISNPCMDDPTISLDRFFIIRENEMTITYKPTGQMIIFKGMDDPQKIQGIRVPKGFLTDVYVEEAFELDNYDEWRKVDGSIRGKLPNGLFHQITFVLNSWDMGHWLYEKFFKDRFEDSYEYLESHKFADYLDTEYLGDFGKGLYLHTSTYKINEFRDVEIYDKVMLQLKNKAPEIYKVEALGMWGNTTDAVYPEMTDDLIKPRQEINNLRYSCYAIGIDTGLSNGEGKIKKGENVKIRSATTMELVGLTHDYSKLAHIREFYYSNEQQIVKKTEPQLMTEIIETIIKWREDYAMHRDLMKGIILVFVDCADIGFRQGLELEAKRQGLYNVHFEGSTKMKIQTRVDFIRLLMAMGESLYSEDCKNLIRETKNARRGPKGECREDIDDHSINASEYGWAAIINRLKRWKTFKER